MILYKFKTINDSNCKYIYDIIEKSRLYCALINELNDPDEGFPLQLCYDKNIDGIECGIERVNKINEWKRNLINHRILSLTDSFESRLMWAHYGSGGSGVSLRVDIPVDVAKKVDYVSEVIQTFDSNPIFALKNKFKEWEYEREYRIIVDSSIMFYPVKITGVIIGMEFNFEYWFNSWLLKRLTEQNIPILLPSETRREVMDISEMVRALLKNG